MTALVSLGTSPEEQGKALGVFRSVGALARVFGPLTAAVIYWRFGQSMPYLAGALLMGIPIFLLATLTPQQESLDPDEGTTYDSKAAE